MVKKLPAAASALLLALLLAAVPAAAAGETGTELPDWCSDAVSWALQEDLFPGAFTQGRPVSRAEAVCILWRLEGRPAPGSWQSPFPDIPADHPAAPAVLWAAEQGIVQGDRQGLFRPDELCTRSQAASLLWRMEGQPAVAPVQVFSDVQPDSWFGTAAAWASNRRILSGDGSGRFLPDELCTMEQFAVMLYRTAPDLTGGLELPVSGATGFASVDLPVFQSPGTAETEGSLKPGDPFLILEESGDWWHINAGTLTGWVEHRLCMINLPDVIPSILYDDTNSYSSRMVSSGRALPGITGEALYSCRSFNPRLGREEYVMPMLYAAARQVCTAQQAALDAGTCLQVYETFRPAHVQKAIAGAVQNLAASDPEVMAGLASSPWRMNDFIALNVSNHQRGIALDVSLVRVEQIRTEHAGSLRYISVSGFQPCAMPTEIHELSRAAASAEAPGSLVPSSHMTEAALQLRGFFQQAGMTPLASEWWHFNAFDALPPDRPCLGQFEVSACLSRAPASPGEAG